MTAAIAFNASPRVQAAIASAASSTGVDFTYLLHQARVESGFDANARARTSSASGLYQFVEQSWLGTVKRHGEEHGLGWAADAIERGRDGRMRVADSDLRQAILDLRRNPEASAAMAAEFASDNRATLEARLGHTVEPVDLYLAHFLGSGGATRFLKNFEADPDRSAAELFPAAARANRAVFFARDGSARTLGDVRERFAAKFAQPAPVFRRAELVSASASPRGPTSPEARWTPNRVRGDGMGVRATPPNARLAYLMLASLGVS